MSPSAQARCRVRLARIAPLVLVLLGTQGCSRWIHQPEGLQAIRESAYPKTVRVTLANGEQRTLVAPTFAGDTIFTMSDTVMASQVRSVEVQAMNGPRTALATLAVVVVLSIAYLGVGFASFSP